jgi:hypothetical protein
MGLFSNAGVGQANSAYNQAFNTSGMLGGEAQGIGANLTPFLTNEMLHPQGFGQQGLSAMNAAASGGAGGALSAFEGGAAQRAGAMHNAGAFQASMDDASRNAEKARAGASEEIAAKNAGLQQEQSQEGAAGLGGMYKTDTSGMLTAMGQEAPDINAGVNASKAGPGWLSDLGMGVNDTLGVAKLGAGFGIPGFGGFKPQPGGSPGY